MKRRSGPTGRLRSAALAFVCLLAFFGGAATEAAAAEAAEYPAARLGNEAFAAGDYPSAIRFYTQYRDAAAADPDAAADAVRRLISAYLRAGKLNTAAAELAAIPRKGIPERLLEADLRLLRREYPEAEKAYRALLAGGGLSGADFCRIQAGLGEARLGRKDPAGALSAYEKLSATATGLPEWEFLAWRQRVALQIAAGKYAEAEALLKSGAKFQTPAEQKTRDLLTLQLLLARTPQAFPAAWEEKRKSFPDAPDAGLEELASNAAEKLAETAPGAAARLYADAFNFSEDAVRRRLYLRARVNAFARAGAPAKAAEALTGYLEFYPGSPDRGDLMRNLARLFAASGETSRALQTYREMLDPTRQLDRNERKDAAWEGGTLAEKSGDAAGAESFFRERIALGASRQEKAEGEFRLGEFYFGAKRFAEARAAFDRAAQTPALNRRAVFQRMRAERELGDFAAVLATAEALQNTADDLSAQVLFHRALALEKLGKRAAAQELYVHFARENASSELAPTAWNAAAALALRAGERKEAIQLLQEFYMRHPDHPRQAAAQYLLLRAALQTREEGASAEALKTLETRFAATPYRCAGLFLRFDDLRTRELYQEALAVLDRIAALSEAKNPGTAAQLHYDRATVLIPLGDGAKAAVELRNVLDRYVASPIYADAALLAANLAADSGHYAEAAALYERVLKLRPAGLAAAIVSGRLADARYSLYTRSLDAPELAAATELYRKLAGTAPDETMKLQSLYKLGKCCELADRIPAALAAYREVLYRAVDMQRRKIAVDPVWPGKAAYAAALVLFKRGTPGAARDAMRIMRTYQSLGFETGEDLDQLAEMIRRKYKIQP